MLLKNQSIRKRIIFASLIVTLIPMLLLESFFIVMTRRNSFETVMDTAAVHVDQLEDNYSSELNQLEHVAATLANFSPLLNYLSMNFPSDWQAFSYYSEHVHPMLHGCNEVYKGASVRIYHGNEEFRNFSYEVNNGMESFMETYFPENNGFSHKGFWTGIGIRHNTQKAILNYYLAVRETEYPYDTAYVITVQVDDAFFYKQIANEPVDTRRVYVLDKTGTILASNQQKLAGKTLRDLPMEDSDQLLLLEDQQQVSMDGRQYVLFHRKTEELDIVYLVDYASVHSTNAFFITVLLILGASLLLLSAGLILQLTGRITRDIETLKRKMVNINRERIRSLASSDAKENNGDEIKQLEIVFTGMMGELNILMDQIQKKERELKDEIITRQQAEIRALQHQIDPHYLFNTLEAIRMNLMLKNDRENAEIVKLFAESFRRYIDMRDEYVTLLEEVDFIQKYIRIQNYRLDNKITFICDSEERFLGYRVVKLLLQPLVENAVCHGIDPKETGGTIILQIKKTKKYLEIAVEDDGIGLSAPETAQLQKMIYENRQSGSVGLRNIYQRVQLVYGPEADLTIESEKGRGTKVRLQLPLDALEGLPCIKS